MKPQRRWLVGLVMVVVACGKADDGPAQPPAPTDTIPADTGPSDTGPTDTGVVDPCHDSLATWENVAKPFLDNWCTACHSSEVSGVDRQGAPEGIDFDRWELAAPFAQLIRSSALVDGPRMPPAGGTQADERAAVDEWVECGALGPTTPAGPCDELVAGISDDPCRDGFNAVTGDLTAGDVDLRCLCDLEGSLTLDGPVVDLPLLALVGGSVSATAGLVEVLAPALTQVGGDLRVTSSPLLASWSTPALRDVGGSVRFEGATALTTLQLDQLSTISGDLDVHAVVGLTDLELPRVEHVGGSYRVTSNPDLLRLPFLYELESVGADLVISGNPLLSDLILATYLTQLGGSVEIAGNGLVVLAGLHDLTTIPGDLHIHDEPHLTEVIGLEDLTAVGGAITFEALPELVALPEFGLLASAGGLALRDLPLFNGSGARSSLTQISGDLVVERCDAMPGVPWAEDVTHVTGHLVLNDVALIAGLGTLQELNRVDGRLVFTDLPALTRIDQLSNLQRVGGIQFTRLGALDEVGLLALESSTGDVSLLELPALTELSLGRAALERDLHLEDLDALTSLARLHPLVGVGGDLTVTGNASLPASEVTDLTVAVPVFGSVFATDNDG